MDIFVLTVTSFFSAVLVWQTFGLKSLLKSQYTAVESLKGMGQGLVQVVRCLSQAFIVPSANSNVRNILIVLGICRASSSAESFTPIIFADAKRPFPGILMRWVGLAMFLIGYRTNSWRLLKKLGLWYIFKIPCQCSMIANLTQKPIFILVSSCPQICRNLKITEYSPIQNSYKTDEVYDHHWHYQLCDCLIDSIVFIFFFQPLLRE